LSFDDYGDATRTGGKKPLVLPVVVRREFLSDNRFQVVTGKSFRQRLRLVVFKSSANTCRLVVLGTDRRWDHSPERVLELRGPETVPDEIGDRPMGDRFHLRALGHEKISDGTRHRIYRIGASGSLKDGGTLSIDPNRLLFHPDGSVGGSTLLGWIPPEVLFRSLGPDPANRGRRAFEVVPKKAEGPAWPKTQRFILVLGPTELSEHRLVIRDEGRVAQVLSLRMQDRDNHLHMLGKLKEVPAEERAAFRELGLLGNYRTIVQTENGHVTGLHIVEGDLARVDPILARFPHLQATGFHEATLPPGGLPCLGQLPQLSSLAFNNCNVPDPGLASVGRGGGLRTLSFYGCRGPTAAGLVHLAPLTNLDRLEIRQDSGKADGPPLDEELRHLAGMKRLTRLNLTGQPLTDAGLVHIGRLTSLRELYLSGDLITDDGLEHLEGLAGLQTFTPYGARISPEAMKAFRDKLPGLRKGP
jgi:hypothetical protein